MTEAPKQEPNGYTFTDFYAVTSMGALEKESFSYPTITSVRPMTTSDTHQSDRCRVYFISYPELDPLVPFKPTLFACNVTYERSPDRDGTVDELPWFFMLPAGFGLNRSPISLAESLLHERMRTYTDGVSDYRVSPDGHVVLTSCSRIYCCNDTTSITDRPVTLDPVVAPVLVPLQPSPCPTNANVIACVGDGQLTVGLADTNTWVPLTHFDLSGGLSVGMPSFVVQEEFDRYIGFWWQPRPSTITRTETDGAVHRILYEMVDEHRVQVVHLLNDQTVETHRYPRAGTPNASSDLRICEFRISANGEISNIKHFALPGPLLQYLPGEFEYLVRADWTPDSRFPLYEMPASDSRWRCMLLIEATEPEPQLSNASFVSVWVHDYLAFLTKSTLPSTTSTFTNDTHLSEHMSFIWASHRSGFQHLYLFHRSWSKQGGGQNHPDDETSLSTMAHVLDAEDLFTSQLTHGNWEVTGQEIWLDEPNEVVYFEANRSHPMLRHIYAVSYASLDRGCLTCITPEEHHHPTTNEPQQQSSSLSSCLDPAFPSNRQSADYPLTYTLSSFDPVSGWAVLTSSSLGRMMGIQVVRIRCPPVGVDSNRLMPVLEHVVWLHKHDLHDDVIALPLRPFRPPMVLRCDINQQRLQTDNVSPNTVITPPRGDHDSVSSGQDVFYGLLYTPSTPCPPDGYPTIHYVYGGPGVQLVRGGYPKSLLASVVHYCRFGYAVLLCDCRGSSNRGIRFAGHVKHKLGIVELDDHVAFLHHVTKGTKLIDLTKVAIMGHSFGGYMSLMAAMRYQHVYQVAVAGSPVVDWTLYDTAYTERYLGLPQDHSSSYWDSNVLSYVDQMPVPDTARLLVAHGAMDENVHFQHTARLLHRLETTGKPYKLLYYPTSRHGIKEYEHLEASALLLLEAILQPIRSDTNLRHHIKSVKPGIVVQTGLVISE